MLVRERLCQREDAVSPVVGMILVLGISVVGIAAILYWGLPAIDEMKANVEHRSLESQFHELDASIKELVAGTTERTAKRWQPTLNRGSVVMANETEGWVYAVELYNPTKTHSFVYGAMADGNNQFTIFNNGEAAANGIVQAFRLNSVTSAETLVVSKTSLPAGVWNAKENWAVNSGRDLYLFDSNGNAVPIRNSTIKFVVWDDTTIIAQAWFVPTGRVDYSLSAGLGTKSVTQNNGAVLSGNGDAFALLSSPPIPPAATISGTPRHFARAVALNGTGSFAGDDRFDILVTLYSTFTLASYDCATVTTGTCVDGAKIFIFGTLDDAWYQYLTNAARGYTFEKKPAPTNTDCIGCIDYLEDRENYMGYTLLQSTVQMAGS